MEWYWLTIIALILLACGIFAVWKTDFQRPQLGLDQRMKDFAAKAVLMAAKDYRVSLDYTNDSINRLEPILQSFHERHRSSPIPDKELSRIVLIWGGYVGTTLLKFLGDKGLAATWQADSATAGINTYPIVWVQNEGEQREAIPVIWCLKRIRHGERENLVPKFHSSID